MEHDKCTIYRSYIDSAKLFAKDRAELAEAVLVAVEYALYGIEYEGDDVVAKSTFINSKPLSEASWKFYENGKRGGEAKAKGGRKEVLGRGVEKGCKEGVLDRGVEKGCREEGSGRGASMIIDMEKEMEKEKELEEDIEIEEKDISSGDASISSSDGASDEAVAESRKSKLKKLEIVGEVVEYYNSRIAETQSNLRSCKTLSDRRRNSIKARVDEHGLDKVKEMIDRAVASSFLNYDAKNAPMDIDWLFSPNNFPKVLDGNYDNKCVAETDTNIYKISKNNCNGNNVKKTERRDIDLRLGRDLPKEGYRDSF